MRNIFMSAILIIAATAFCDAQTAPQKEAAKLADRGFSQIAGGNYDEAAQSFDSCLKIDAKNDECYVGRGSVTSQKGDYKAAIADFNQALKINPNSSGAYRMRGFLNWSLLDFDSALEDLSNAVAMDSENPAGFYYRGLVYADQQEYKKAIADFSKAAELMPDNALIYARRGDCYQELGDKPSAIADYRKALQIDPNNDSALGGLKSLGVDPSVAEKPQPPITKSPTNSPAPRTDAERYKAIGDALKGGKNVSDADITWALQYEKNHPKKS